MTIETDAIQAYRNSLNVIRRAGVLVTSLPEEACLLLNALHEFKTYDSENPQHSNRYLQKLALGVIDATKQLGDHTEKLNSMIDSNRQSFVYSSDLRKGNEYQDYLLDLQEELHNQPIENRCQFALNSERHNDPYSLPAIHQTLVTVAVEDIDSRLDIDHRMVNLRARINQWYLLASGNTSIIVPIPRLVDYLNSLINDIQAVTSIEDDIKNQSLQALQDIRNLANQKQESTVTNRSSPANRLFAANIRMVAAAVNGIVMHLAAWPFDLNKPVAENIVLEVFYPRINQWENLVSRTAIIDDPTILVTFIDDLLCDIKRHAINPENAQDILFEKNIQTLLEIRNLALQLSAQEGIIDIARITAENIRSVRSRLDGDSHNQSLQVLLETLQPILLELLIADHSERTTPLLREEGRQPQSTASSLQITTAVLFREIPPPEVSPEPTTQFLRIEGCG